MRASTRTASQAAVLALFTTMTTCAPLSPRDMPPVAPTVDSMSMTGPGCPIGSAGIVQEMRNGTPVFLFAEWGLSLADPDGTSSPVGATPGNSMTSVSKFCNEEISLGNGSPGWQVRISAMQVGGWADLAGGATLGVMVDTKLGGVAAGSASSTLTAADLKSNTFSVSLKAAPESWSACIGADGKVPPIVVKTTVALNGTATSPAVVGGEKTDLKKALSLHFDSDWRKCP